MLTNIMCENVHRCTFSRQLDVSNGHLCPKWNIEAFLMLAASIAASTVCVVPFLKISVGVVPS